MSGVVILLSRDGGVRAPRVPPGSFSIDITCPPLALFLKPAALAKPSSRRATGLSRHARRERGDLDVGPAADRWEAALDRMVRMTSRCPLPCRPRLPCLPAWAEA
jgi:hypothetical protein